MQQKAQPLIGCPNHLATGFPPILHPPSRLFFLYNLICVPEFMDAARAKGPEWSWASQKVFYRLICGNKTFFVILYLFLFAFATQL